MQQRHKDIKDALDRDIKMLEEFAKMELEAKQANARRRAELQREMQMYRVHLKEQREIERQRELELEEYYSKEQEKVFFSLTRLGD
jgi:vacuolar-type H+-ATPase subunit I/STV1